MKTEDVFIESIDKTVRFLIGKSAKDNFFIIDKSEPTDLWFHFKDFSGCHIIAETPTGVDNTDIIKTGAELCVKNTNKLKNVSKVYINYDFIRNIKKTKNIGEVNVNYSTLKEYKVVLFVSKN